MAAEQKPQIPHFGPRYDGAGDEKTREALYSENKRKKKKARDAAMKECLHESRDAEERLRMELSALRQRYDELVAARDLEAQAASMISTKDAETQCPETPQDIATAAPCGGCGDDGVETDAYDTDAETSGLPARQPKHKEPTAAATKAASTSRKRKRKAMTEAQKEARNATRRDKWARDHPREWD